MMMSSDILIHAWKSKYKKYAKLFNDKIKYHINPTGKFVIGGPHGDTGLTGRKIIVDTYGGKGAHGGGAFSGKDPSKVDRSAAYATQAYCQKPRWQQGYATELLVQVSYAIGVAKPTSINVNTFGTAKVKLSDGEIAREVLRRYLICVPTSSSKGWNCAILFIVKPLPMVTWVVSPK